MAQAQSFSMASPAGTANTQTLTPDPAGYQVDDLTIDLAPRRVRRAGTLIRLQALSFDLLVTLVRAAPNLASFEHLSERVWPGLVITPETIVQRVKLLRNALGDDPHAPRYIEGVRGRGYRMVAAVRPLTERQGTPEPVRASSLEESKAADGTSLGAGIADTEAVAGGSRSAGPPASRVALRWFGGTLIIVVLLAAYWAIVSHRGASKPAERTSSGSAAIHSLAVLPLENLSGDKEQEYFADGMTDALTNDLAQLGSLRVISRTSAMHFKGSKETLPQIGRDLEVDAVVEGTVAHGDNRVRVTAQLVEANSDHHLWAKSYERDLKNVLAMQDEIAQDITEQIRVRVTPEERKLVMQVHAIDPEAYDASLRGWYWLNQLSPEGSRKALDYFHKAIAADPNYSLAYAGLADSFLQLAFSGDLPLKTVHDQARDAAVKALALDPSLAEAHVALGNLKFWSDWDWSGAEAEFKRATTLNPNNANAHFWYSNYLLPMGRLDDAMKEIEISRDLDPFSVAVAWWRGQVLYHARRYDDAVRQNQRGLEMHPDNVMFYEAMADVYEQKKMFAEAFAVRQRALNLSKDPNVTALGEAYQRAGYRGYLLKEAEIMGAEPDNPAYASHVFALLNDEARAMTALELAYNKRNACVLYLRTAPELDSIRSSPRFRALVRRMGFPQPSAEKH